MSETSNEIDRLLRELAPHVVERSIDLSCSRMRAHRDAKQAQAIECAVDRLRILHAHHVQVDREAVGRGLVPVRRGALEEFRNQRVGCFHVSREVLAFCQLEPQGECQFVVSAPGVVVE